MKSHAFENVEASPYFFGCAAASLMPSLCGTKIAAKMQQRALAPTATLGPAQADHEADIFRHSGLH